MGSVFSPYYRWALQRAERRARAQAPGDGAERAVGGVHSVDPMDHCALNVALYGDAGGRWTMTERGRKHVQREPHRFTVGPSALHWDGNALRIDIDETSVPVPRRVRGTVRVVPAGLSTFVTALDESGRHRWGPIAPCARVEVDMMQPSARWQGHGYFDSNEGDEPIDRPFLEWDWSRASLRDGSTGVIYDVRQRAAPDRVLAYRFAPSGKAEAFEAPARQALSPSRWRLARSMRTDANAAAGIVHTLEDTPFYVRSVVRAGLLGEPVIAMHETLNVPRLVSTAVQFMLPWRMPRVR